MYFLFCKFVFFHHKTAYDRRSCDGSSDVCSSDLGTDELGGPIRIADMSGQAAEMGIGTLIYFAAVLSINRGLINLFPVPMLDGGHLLFYAVEALREIGRAHV